jgi:hypothetical protein
MAGRFALAYIGIVVSFLSPMISAHAFELNQGAACTLSAAGGLFQGQTGVMVNGECEPVNADPVGDSPALEYRYVGCEADGTAIYLATVLTGTRCNTDVPRCTLLMDGGQSGPHPVVAYEDQVRQQGSAVWINLGFWCPQSTAPLPAAGPDVAAIRDRVVRLLPRVAAVTTGPNTLVNIQTLLWADTAEQRSLGRVTVVGQPVWLRLAFDHAVWDFGDGSRASSAVPGKAYDAVGDPCRTVSCPDYFGHTYTRTGAMTVRVQVAWRASYSLDGQNYQPVDDAPITGPAGTAQIHVRQARGILVSTGD